MREAQRLALERFVESGYDQVTVEQIATELGMAPSTIYRHFDTKERLILWDEHDAEVDVDLTARFKTRNRQQSVLSVLGEAFAEVIGKRYQADTTFQLARIDLIYETPQLRAAAMKADLLTRTVMASELQAVLPRAQRKNAPMIAAISLLMLDLALDEWRTRKGKPHLQSLIAAAFEQHSTLTDAV